MQNSTPLAAQKLSGVYAAAVTPLREDLILDFDSLPGLLSFFAGRGCDGALLLGTTGEGPSFSPGERLSLFRTALQVRQVHPSFRLLAGTGTPSLEETVDLTRAAFEMGLDAVVVLPPYYYRTASDDGLFAWFSQVIQRAVPEGSYLLGYHFPRVSGVPLSIELLARLKDAFPDRFAGIKDSSGDAEHARLLGERFGKDLVVLTGSDDLFSQALEQHASGCITATANLVSPDLALVWQAHQRGETDPQAQGRLKAARAVIERYPPAPPLIKALLRRRFGFPRWVPRPPLLPLTPDIEEQAVAEIDAVYGA